jgi:hypothetical protein
MPDKLTQLEENIHKYSEVKKKVDELSVQKETLHKALVTTLQEVGEKTASGAFTHKTTDGIVIVAEQRVRHDEIDNVTIPFLRDKGAIYLEETMARKNVNAAIDSGVITAEEVEKNFLTKKSFQLKLFD